MTSSLKSKRSPLNTDLGQWTAVMVNAWLQTVSGPVWLVAVLAPMPAGSRPGRSFSLAYPQSLVFLPAGEEMSASKVKAKKRTLLQRKTQKGSQRIVRLLLCCVFTWVLKNHFDQILGNSQIIRLSFICTWMVKKNLQNQRKANHHNFLPLGRLPRGSLSISQQHG